MRWVMEFLKSLWRFFHLHCTDAFGPDMVLTHWMLYFKPTRLLLMRRKLGHVGNGAECRPFVSVAGGRNVSLGRNVVVRPFSNLRAGDKVGRIIIEDDVLLGPNLFMSVNVHRFADVSQPVCCQGYEAPRDIVIRRGSWIGAGAIVLPGVCVGCNSVVGAGAVVTRDVPDRTVVAGNPARVLRELQADENMKAMDV
ncbi:MAG: acyltransferase [Thermodesulfobacteriota bacterium]